MKLFHKTSVLLALALTILSAVTAPGQEFWEKKPYQKWSEKETRKLLTDSPWAQSHTLSQTFIQPVGAPGPGAASPARPNQEGIGGQPSDPFARDDSGRARQGRTELKYQAQLRSAPPIRQAIVRLGQITSKYEDMTPEQRMVFDKNAEAFLAKNFPNTMVLYISYDTNIQVDDREMAAHWQRQTTDTLKNFVFLILPGGEKIPLSEFGIAKGGREFQFIFPRSIGGRPIVRSEDKALQLEFIHPKVRDQKESRVLISFKTEKMMINGEAVY